MRPAKCGGRVTSALDVNYSVVVDASVADGGVDGAEVEAFFIDWERSASCADVNHDGGVDGRDVETFFICWE